MAIGELRSILTKPDGNLKVQHHHHTGWQSESAASSPSRLAI
ncbi:hypothetical protein [uncultured Duncaniella sp.]|nr:hypothetical protein [uncultured Duncaniella sp.]